MLSRFLGGFVSCLILLAGPALAESSVEGLTIRVQVVVSADDPIGDDVTGHLSRELGTLGDVMVTDTSPHYKIHCIVLDLSTVAGTRTGYALSVVVEGMLLGRTLKCYLAPKLDPDEARFVEAYVEHGVVAYHFLRTCGPDDLQWVCRDVVASIDGSTFDSCRKWTQSQVDSLRTTR